MHQASESLQGLRKGREKVLSFPGLPRVKEFSMCHFTHVTSEKPRKDKDSKLRANTCLVAEPGLKPEPKPCCSSVQFVSQGNIFTHRPHTFPQSWTATSSQGTRCLTILPLRAVLSDVLHPISGTSTLPTISGFFFLFFFYNFQNELHFSSITSLYCFIS